MTLSRTYRLVGLVVLQLAMLLVTASPAHAACASDCNDSAESPCATTSINGFLSEGVITSGSTSSWYANKTVHVEHEVLYNGSHFWGDDRTCYNTSQCSFPSTLLPCDYTGAYTSITTGWRNGSYEHVETDATTWYWG